MSTDFTDQLNAPQREAVLHTAGPLVIFAGAGSGKTRTLTRRIAYLMTEQGVPPWRILSVTFTNKAAREMRERIENLVGPSAQKLWMGTFHSMCVRMLRMHGERIGIDPHFVIFDTDDSRKLIKEIVKESGLDSKLYKPASILGQISDAKNKLQRPQGLIDTAQTPLEKHIAQFYKKYQERLRASRALDFDDLLVEAVRLLMESKETQEYWSERFLHVLIDEFQDANLAQFTWAQLLASKHKNICVVGDDDQSIYAWRGADVRQILHFNDSYPNAKTIRLEQNYRSTENILEAAYGVISRNLGRSPKKLWTDGEQGKLLTLHGAPDARKEVYWVIDQIRELQMQGVQYSQIAILCRVNAQSAEFERTFMRMRVPLRLVGTQKFYDRLEIKDLTSYLRVIYNPHDNISLSRIINVPARSIGATTLDRLSSYAAQNECSMWEILENAEEKSTFTPATQKKLLPFYRLLCELRDAAQLTDRVDELLKLIIDRTGYIDHLLHGKDDKGEDRARNVNELLNAAAEFMPQEQADEDGEIVPSLDALDYLGQFLETITLDDEHKQAEEEGKAVTLMTLHGAKGLEFPYVFMVGMEQGLLPHSRALRDENATEEDLEEERRLCYVGLTRAEKQIFLSYADQRMLFGRTEMTQPSQFLKEIPPHLLERSGSSRYVDTPSVTHRSTNNWGSRNGGSARFTSPKRRVHTPPISQKREATASAEEIDAPSTYEVGDRLRHPKFGEGLVTKMSPHGGKNEWVEIAFLQSGVGTKKLAVHYAKLEKIA